MSYLLTIRNLACLVLMMFACIPACSHAQNQYGQETLEDGLLDPFIRYPAIPSHIIDLRDRWAAETLNWVDETLQAHPPQVDPPTIRIQALAAMDDPLHLGEAPVLDVIADFYQKRVQRGLAHLQSTERPTQGAKIWKFYNCTFVIKTAHHAFAFDVSHGYRKVTTTKAQLRNLAQQIDVAFISHDHPDHADAAFAHEMAALGKKVVVPDVIWPNSDIEKSLVRVSGTYKGEVEGLSFIAYPGSQGASIPNPVYLVQADGVSFMHMGDQSRSSDYNNWIKGIGKKHDVDVLFINCRDSGMGRKITAIDPKLIIPGHENEIRHIVDGRQGIVRTLSNLKDIKVPVVLMSWGEYFQYVK
ncbi:MAG: MBL fold metallo-hydrolase [Sedimentisphaerales bacterium]|nr:MBL fold metallo-hydrolase [Sedimentisphaerales bacterium]